MRSVVISVQVLILFYHQATTLLDFYPFNGSRFATKGERAGEAAFNFVLMALPPIGFYLGSPRLMQFGVGYYVVLFAAECATWWLPYFVGPSAQWAEAYSRIQGRTFTVVPARGDNPRPNLEHLILMGLTLLVATTTWVGSRAIPGASLKSVGILALVGLVVIAGVAFQCSSLGRKMPKPPSS